MWHAIVSLDEDLPPDEGVEAAWLDEIKRRDAEIERGDVQTIPAEEVMRRVSDSGGFPSTQKAGVLERL